MDEKTPQVEGMRLLEPADDAGRGELWRARHIGGLAGADGARLPADLPGVGECRVRLLRLPVDEVLRARAQTLAGDLLALDDPGLVPIRSVRKGYDGIALVYGHLPSGSTSLQLLARRRLLAAGEIVTLGVALCWALAHAHEAGIAHGRLSDADVLIGADGRPMLSGVGVLGILGAPGEAAADVRALERMLASLLDRESVGASRVAEVLGAASPNAGALAARLAGSTPAAPIRVEEAVAGPRDRPAPRRRWGLWAPRHVRPRALAAAAGVVLLGALVGWASAPGQRPRSAPVAEAHRPARAGQQPVDWRQVLTKLDLARSVAFEQSNPSALAEVDLPGSQAHRYDAAADSALRAHGVHAVGLRMVLEQVTVKSATAQRVTLQVTDRRLPYELRDSRGRLVSRVAARGTATHLIQLETAGAAGAASWRFATVSDPAVTS